MATALLAALVADALNEVAYDAELAGLSWGVDAAYQSLVPGLDVRVSGYNDKLPVLLREVLSRLATLTVRPERFAVVKERFVLALRNWRAKQPYMWASRLLEQAIMNGARPQLLPARVPPRRSGVPASRLFDHTFLFLPSHVLGPVL